MVSDLMRRLCWLAGGTDIVLWQARLKGIIQFSWLMEVCFYEVIFKCSLKESVSIKGFVQQKSIVKVFATVSCTKSGSNALEGA